MIPLPISSIRSANPLVLECVLGRLPYVCRFLPLLPVPHVEEDSLWRKVRNEVNGRQADANTTEPVKATYPDVSSGEIRAHKSLFETKERV